MPDERAVNPYDFIPFGCGPERKPLEEYYDDKPLSGWFDVQLQIKTPLIIPDASHVTPERVFVSKKEKPVEEEHKHYGFFRLPNGALSIPGSALRGMLRSVYEAATDSCIPFLPVDDPKHPISQRTPLYAAFKYRGLLCFEPKSGVWSLYKAKAYLIETTKAAVSTGRYQGFHQGQQVRFHVKPDKSVVLGRGDQLGWLQFNVPVDPDKPYHVAVLEKRKLEHTESETELAQGDISMYQSMHTAVYDSKQNVKKFHLNSAEPDLFYCLHKVKKEGGAVPCYYFIVERDGKKLVYLSGAAVGRVRQRRTWPDIMGNHGPCKQLDCLCPACALFGTVQDGGTAGRLSFSDAEAIDCSEPAERTLPILSTPRTSSFEFYLRKPHEDATYWNFDYYGVKSSREIKKDDGGTVTISGTDYRDLAEATPRGRKMYWHGAAQTSEMKSKQNATMEVIEHGIFRFRIRFDRITRTQLGDLLWCVSLGDNKPSSKYRHKLGHGKPVGYGSVKLSVDQVYVRAVVPEDGFAVCVVPVSPAEYLDAPERASDLKSQQTEAIRRMTDFDATKGLNVAYLTGWDNRGRETIYAWFQANRMSADDVLTLPEPTTSDLSLPNKRGKRPSRDNASSRKGQKPSGPPQHIAGRLQEGEILRDVKVKKVNRDNAYFFLPESDCDGHCRLPFGTELWRGQRVNVKIRYYNDKYRSYEVEVLQA